MKNKNFLKVVSYFDATLKFLLPDILGSYQQEVRCTAITWFLKKTLGAGKEHKPVNRLIAALGAEQQ